MHFCGFSSFLPFFSCVLIFSISYFIHFECVCVYTCIPIYTHTYIYMKKGSNNFKKTENFQIQTCIISFTCFVFCCLSCMTCIGILFLTLPSTPCSTHGGTNTLCYNCLFSPLQPLFQWFSNMSLHQTHTEGQGQLN